MAVRLPELAVAMLAKRGPNGHAPAFQGMASLIEPYFGANTRQIVTVTPDANNHAVIVYHVSYGQTPLDTFTITIDAAGNRVFSGRLTEEDIADGHDLWTVITAKQPLTLDIANDDPVTTHAFRVRLHYLTVPQESDLAALQALANQYQMPQGWALR